MSEEDPTLDVTFGDVPFEVNRRNTFLYTYLGGLGIYDHVFVLNDQEEGRGWYVFKEHMGEGYTMLAKFVVENSLILHMNLQDISQGDIDAWNNAMLNDIEDGIPRDWEDPC